MQPTKYADHVFSIRNVQVNRPFFQGHLKKCMTPPGHVFIISKQFIDIITLVTQNENKAILNVNS